MESFEEPGHIGRENLLEVPTLSNCFSEEEDVKATHQHRFSPGPRRRNSDSSEEMEAEIPSTIARKVSFADAFGFDLVSVKEFDSWDNPVTQLSDDLEDEDVPVEEFYLTPLFLIPTTQGELLQTVRAHKMCLEFVEFLPGIICMKGIIRVLNISFQKLVYVRMSLDNWLTYYDILAEYVPNSCDGETDQFLFKISLVPPYQKEGAKVEFCIRYETSVGIFWSNNNNKNYILICHKKGTASSLEDNNLQEEVTNKHIKSCLKTTLNSKQETLTTTDKDIWINPRISDSSIPEIVYSHVDNENKYRKENEEEKNADCNEDDKENEKELELLLSQHLTRSRSSSTNERNSYATEPVRFPDELQQLGDKLESGLIRQPLPRSYSTEHALQDKELQKNQTCSIGNDRQLLFPEKYREVDSLNKSAQSIEGLNPNETYSSLEYWSEIKKNQTAYIPDIVSSNCRMHQAYVPSDEFRNVPGNKTKETLFIEGKIVSEQGVHCEVPLKHSELSSQGLHNKEAEEGSIWNSFSHIGPTTEPKICHLDEKLVGSCYKNYSVISPKGFVGPHVAEEMLPPSTDASTEIAAQSGCNFNPKDEITHVILNITKTQEFPPSENREGNIGQFSHQKEFSPGKQIRPTILIREPAEKTEKTSLDSEGLITEKKMNIVRRDKQAFFGHTGVSGQQNEAYNSPAECLVLKHIAYKILYFLLFIVFCVTLYHYDLIVCFALYLFSLCWLYCDGRRNKNSIKKE
ncbi:protein phosphatase 1 regulatory subunit 3A isoform X4 [Ahaetulla prasina]|uniref:protein phosphatase 1 regulatory subunit 3A isoform X4 n=1 Tax=Ahaetulla prasina TaxID=499056 RepID=UPI002647C97B|nr:protein phosphatase 1 regulatory subunit 3A isoform X4 [Ahaetulla prasina]